MSFKIDPVPQLPEDEQFKQALSSLRWSVAYGVIGVLGAILLFFMLVEHKWWLAFYSYILTGISSAKARQLREKYLRLL